MLSSVEKTMCMSRLTSIEQMDVQYSRGVKADTAVTNLPKHSSRWLNQLCQVMYFNTPYMQYDHTVTTVRRIRLSQDETIRRCGSFSCIIMIIAAH